MLWQHSLGLTELQTGSYILQAQYKYLISLIPQVTVHAQNLPDFTHN